MTHRSTNDKKRYSSKLSANTACSRLSSENLGRLLEAVLQKFIKGSRAQRIDIRRKSANYQIVGTAQSQWGAMFAELAENIAGSIPNKPAPLTQDGLLGLFDSKDTGGNIVLEPATDADMRGKHYAPKPSLEVVYDDV